MKNLFKKSVLGLLLLTATLASANVNFNNVRIFSENSKSLNLQLNNNDGESEIFIKDKYGIQLYNEQFNGKQFSKKFDLALLPDGEYIVEIEGQTKIRVLPFNVSGSKVEVLENSKVLIYKPIMRVEGDLVYISKFSSMNENLKIAFFDADNNLLLEDKLDNKMVTGKIFNIRLLPKGNYKVTAKYDSYRTTVHEIVR